MTEAKINTRITIDPSKLIDIEDGLGIRSDTGRIYYPNQMTISGENDEFVMVYHLPGALDEDFDYTYENHVFTDSNSWYDPSRLWDESLMPEDIKSTNYMPHWLWEIYTDFRGEKKEKPEPVDEFIPMTIVGTAPDIGKICYEDGNNRDHQWEPYFNQPGTWTSNAAVYLQLGWRCVICDRHEVMEMKA